MKKTELNSLEISFDKNIVLGEELGQGGFGTVYRATYLKSDAAVKTLIKTMTPQTKEEFLKEMNIMYQLRHAHIIQLYGISTNPYAIVMEYMPKGALYNLIHSKEDITWMQRYQIGLDIGKGIHFLHTNKIIHRDLKSLNVLLDSNYKAKLCDFGLAKVKAESTSGITKKGMMVGSARWKAPELCVRGNSATTASDIYAYGMILWEMVERKLPYQEETNEQMVISFIKSGEQEKIPNGPRHYIKSIEASWKIKPAERFTAEQLIDLLEEGQKLQSEQLEIKIETPPTGKPQDSQKSEFSYIIKTPLQESPPSTPPQPPPSNIVCSLPKRNLYFTGRIKMIENLVNNFEILSSFPLTRQIIIGLGGVGKTQLANEYAYRSRDLYALIWWFDGSRGQIGLDEGYRELALIINREFHFEKIDTEIISPSQLRAKVKECLHLIKNWLLLFDDVPNEETIINYLPSSNTPGSYNHIIITSRNAHWPEEQTLKMEPFKLEESIELLRLIIKGTPQNGGTPFSPQERTQAIELADSLLGNLPLALTHAGFYIKQSGSNLKEYIDIFRKYRRMLLSQPKMQVPYYRSLPLATTWKVSIPMLEETAYRLICYSAYLSSSAISRKLLIELLNTDALSFDGAIIKLRSYSIIDVDSSSQTISVHQLLQAVIRDGILLSQARGYIKKTLRVLDQHFRVAGINYKEVLLPHMQAILLHTFELGLEDFKQEVEAVSRHLARVTAPLVVKTGGLLFRKYTPRFCAIYFQPAREVVETIVDSYTLVPGEKTFFKGFGSPDTPDHANFFGFNSPTKFGEVVTFTGFYNTNEYGNYFKQGNIIKLIADTKTLVPQGTGTFQGLDGPYTDGSMIVFRGLDSQQKPGLYAYEIKSGHLFLKYNTKTSIPQGTGCFTDMWNLSFDENIIAFKGKGESEQEGVYCEVNGKLEAIADKKTNIPGCSQKFIKFGGPSLHKGKVAFRAQGEKGIEGIYTNANSKKVLAVAIDNRTLVLGTELTFTSLQNPTLDNGNIAFLGLSLSEEYSRGIWVYTSEGLIKVAHEGEKLEGKTIKSLELGPEALRGDRLAYQTILVDGSSKIQEVNIFHFKLFPTKRIASPEKVNLSISRNLLQAPKFFKQNIVSFFGASIFIEEKKKGRKNQIELDNEQLL